MMKDRLKFLVAIAMLQGILLAPVGNGQVSIKERVTILSGVEHRTRNEVATGGYWQTDTSGTLVFEGGDGANVGCDGWGVILTMPWSWDTCGIVGVQSAHKDVPGNWSAGTNVQALLLANNIDLYPCSTVVTKNRVEFWYEDYPGSRYPKNFCNVVRVVPGPEFDHFLVQCAPDTVAHCDTSRITVTAVDAGNQEVSLAGNTLLTFVLDSARYGQFIGPSGQLVSSPLSNVSYNDAMAGKVKVVADEVNPMAPGPKPVLIEVSTVGANGTGTLYVDRVNIKIQGSRDTLEPLGNSGNKLNPRWVPHSPGPDGRKQIIDFRNVDTTKVSIIVTKGQQVPIPNYPVTIQALVRDTSGGHNHSINRPRGRFVTSTSDTLSTVSATTGQDGKIQLVYLASGIGGRDSIAAVGRLNDDSGSCLLTLKFKNFVLYTSGSNDTLIGATTTHPSNHYATQATISLIRQLCDSAYAANLRRLQLNDMSLWSGGPFDIYCDRDTAYNWNTPHEHHREGTNLDMRVTATNGRAITEDWLSRILKAMHKGYKREGNPVHYHLKF